MGRLGLRARIALFFAMLAIGSLGCVAAALWLGMARAGGDPSGFATAGVVAAFGIAGLTTAVWYLFDVNVARPIERLAADLRARAHADVDAGLDHAAARYLGDLGPAARALSERIGDATMSAAERVAAETARLSEECRALTSVLSDIPLAVILVDDEHRILLYDGQAAHALEPVRPLCLGQSVFGYIEETQLRRVLRGLEPRQAGSLALSTVDGTRVFESTVRRLGEGAGYMLTLQCDPDTRSERPLAFDFRSVTRAPEDGMGAASLGSLSYVVFDTETTGLLPEKDAVVQIGAVRAVGTRLVEGEVFDTLVNPGRPIPRTSTEVHGIDEAMVAGAPGMDIACRRFLHFAEGAVLVAHNAPFDMAFLRREAERSNLAMDHPVLDTVLLGAELFGATEPLTLDAIAGRLGVAIPEDTRHTALGDARATADVFLKMLQIFEARGQATLGQLLEVQKAQSRILPDLNG